MRGQARRATAQQAVEFGCPLRGLAVFLGRFRDVVLPSLAQVQPSDDDGHYRSDDERRHKPKHSLGVDVHGGLPSVGQLGSMRTLMSRSVACGTMNTGERTSVRQYSGS